MGQNNHFIDIYGDGGARVYNENQTDNPDKDQGDNYIKNTWLQERIYLAI